MAHEFDSGFCVRERSWHGLENLLTEAPDTWDDARLASGLMWEPRLVPLYFQAEDGSFIKDDNAQRVERDDTAASLGAVSGTFELITHAEMGSIMEPVLAQPGCKLETMGAIKGGRMVWALVLLDEPYTIGGDVDGFGDAVVTLPYFGVMNSHDGTGACKGLFTQVRWVCANTIQAGAADGDRHGAQFSLRHTSGVKARLDDARNIVDQCRAEAARWRTVAEALALLRFTDGQQVEFVERFIPEPPAALTTDRVKANIARDRQEFLHVLRDSVTNAGIQHTGLGLVMAATEYCDHLRGFRNSDTYLGRQILRAEPLKARAVSLVREMAASS